GATYDSNGHRDALVSRQTTTALGSLFIGENGDPKHPLANPLYTDYRGFPPIYIQVGEAETLLDDSRRIAESAKQAGVEVRLDLFAEIQHVFEFMAGHAPEADDAIARMAGWVRPRLGLARGASAGLHQVPNRARKAHGRPPGRFGTPPRTLFAKKL